MKWFSYSLLIGAMSVVTSAPSFGAITYTGAVINENFDSLPDSGVDDYYENDSNVVEWGFQRDVVGTSGWEGTQIAGSQTDGSTSGMHLNAITASGSSTAGTVGSAGAGTIGGGDNERGIYMLASGSFTPAMGVEVVNNAAAALASVSISFTQELWRTSGDNASGSEAGTQNVFPAEWGTTGSGVGSADFLTATTGFTAVTDLDVTSNTPVLGDAAVFIDGNDPNNQALRTTTINFGTPVGVGESFFLRFQDFNDPGRDAAIAIDDFSFRATLVPEPSSLLLLGFALISIPLSRRNRNV